MMITGLGFTTDSYKAVQGYMHNVNPEFVTDKPEYDNGDGTVTNAFGGSTGD